MVFIVACSSKSTPTIPQPPYPYGLPKADDADVTEVEIVRAYDGSLLEVRLPGRSLSFDLNLGDVMAPTPAQPWGEKATDALQRLTAGKHALVPVGFHEDSARGDVETAASP
jgi:endonuclease YncB( thermonuclease family)